MERFGFYDHKHFFENWKLLAKGRIYLTKWGKSIFASRLANLVRKPLNWEKQGKGINIPQLTKEKVVKGESKGVGWGEQGRHQEQ